MSTKHFFDSLDGLVVKSLKGSVSCNPSVNLIENQRVTYNPNHNPDKVALISGGGSGHEPGFGGFVGKGQLSASAAGDVFASPNAKQVLAAINSVPSNKGTILIITNYTGDILHFGLAAEKANALGKTAPVLCLPITDDVAVAKNGLVGRRGLTGTVITAKILGAASEAGKGLDECFNLGKSVVSNVVTAGASLDHCHVPGRAIGGMLGQNEAELGLGIHNEPGIKKFSEIPTAESMVSDLLKMMLDQNDPDRSFVKFSPNDTCMLLMNNLGGVSQLEQGALLDEALNQLESKYQIRPVRVFASSYLTSLNAPGFGFSLLNISNMGNVDQILEYIDAPAESLGWTGGVHTQPYKARKDQIQTAKREEQNFHFDDDIQLDKAQLINMLTKACDLVVKGEPKLTEWDTIVGDGDCGYCFKTGAEAVLKAIKEGKFDAARAVETLSVIGEISEDDMGGTSGGILSLFISALSGSVRRMAKSNLPLVEIWSKAASEALEALQRYTPAKVGHRTLMDVLIPFVDTLSKTQDFAQATKVAHESADGTAKLLPKLGRASYVGVEGMDLPPDPGAYGVYYAIQGLFDGLQN